MKSPRPPFRVMPGRKETSLEGFVNINANGLHCVRADVTFLSGSGAEIATGLAILFPIAPDACEQTDEDESTALLYRMKGLFSGIDHLLSTGGTALSG